MEYTAKKKMETQEKIMAFLDENAELRIQRYVEVRVGAPNGMLSRVKHGRENIPAKYLDNLKRELKRFGYGKAKK